MAEEIVRPIPKPRRMIQELTKSQYENVSIDLINKNIHIKDENMQKEIVSKIPNNKVFISGVLAEDDDKYILTETNNLTKSEKNKNIDETDHRPTPAPRRPLNNTSNEQIYENAPEVSPKSTGAISKTQNLVTRKAPEVPKQINCDQQLKSELRAVRSNSIELPREYNEVEQKLKKSVSNSTLDSSISSTSSNNDNQKYKNPSPSDLLKSIGSTSKLLKDAITERVTHKAKGARLLLDKNIKSSQEKLSHWGTETSSRLKNVRKRIVIGGNNFSLSRNEKREPTFNDDRPQTLPPNDQVFQTISFNSPLNKVSNLDNLSSESSYEIPRSIKPITNKSQHGTNLYPICPSYEDAVKSDRLSFTDSDSSASFKGNLSSFERNTDLTQSLITPRQTDHLKIRKPQNMNISVPDLSDLAEERLPMPNYPAPILQEHPLYGKIKQIEPPVRLKRKKNYDAIEIRHSISEPNSNRATIDPNEMPSRDVSVEIKHLIKEQEKTIPNPQRSESWTYREGNDDECSSPEPIYANQEPMYGKLCEMESDEVDQPLVPQSKKRQSKPQRVEPEPAPILEPTTPLPKEILNEFDPLTGSNINEFCTAKSNQLLLLENLLELETYGTLLKDTSVIDDQSLESSDEDNGSVGTSSSLPKLPERVDSLPEQSPQSRRQSSNIQIIHQNPHLRSDSLENIVDEAIVESYLAKVNDTPLNIEGNIDLSRPKHAHSQWFVDDNGNPRNSQRTNPFDKIPKLPPKTDKNNKQKLPPPPSYAEAMSTSTTSISSDTKSVDTKYPSLPETQPTKTTMRSMLSNVFNKMESIKRKTSFRGTRPSDVHIILEMVPKPTLSQRMVLHEGHLIRLPSGGVEDILKEMQNRVAVLRDRKFVTFVDKDMKNQKESFPLEHITTIQCVSNHKFSNNSMQMYCFEVTTAIPKNQSAQQSLSNPNMVMTNTNSGNTKHQRSCHLYGVAKESERDIWMHKIIESLTTVFPRSYMCHYYRAGWCYLKSSITAQWGGAWILLQKRRRRLIFYGEAENNLEKMDLRKARCIVLKESDDSIKNLHVESGPLLMIDCPPYTIYLVMSCTRETKIWRHIIREVAHNNGPALSEQQLTKYNVPVLVDKCINFVYIHGSMSEGIYRKSGSVAAIQKLMSLFRTDSFSVEITRNEYSEHDVANVLKRFMRNLPQRLLGKYSVSFISITKLTNKVERISAYKELLGRLPEIEYETLRKLIGHLAFIQSQKSHNKMGIDNLAMVWGPTLLQDNGDEMSYSQDESDVISDLITFYKNLYHLTPDEVLKEKKILSCLQKYYAAAENLSDSMKQSGDLKVWITLNTHPDNTKEEKLQVNVTLTPTKTAYEVCKELSIKMKLPAHQLTLNEVILNDSLERPFHHSERVFDIVIKWSYWPENDRKNNYLAVKPIKILKEVQRIVKNSTTITPGKELKFADNKTKSMKSLQVELKDGKIIVLKKEKNVATAIKEIVLNEVTVYLGCEKKREFPYRWAITLVDHGNKKILRSRDLPYIGHVIAGTEWEDQVIWLSGIWYSLYGDDIMPPAEIIIP